MKSHEVPLEDAGTAGPVQKGYVESRYGQLHFRFCEPAGAPTRRPLVCLHFTPGSSNFFSAFLPLIGTDRKAVAIDTPGYGNSDGPDTAIDLQGYSDVMFEAIDAMGLGAYWDNTLDLLGTLTGAHLAGMMALRRPERINRLVLAQALFLDSDERGALLRRVETKESNARAELGNRMYVRQLEDALAGLGPNDSPDLALDRFVDSLLARRNTYAAASAALRYSIADGFSAITCPVLLMRLQSGSYTSTLHGSDIIKHAEVLELSATVTSFATDPGKLATPIRAFLCRA